MRNILSLTPAGVETSERTRNCPVRAVALSGFGWGNKQLCVIASRRRWGAAGRRHRIIRKQSRIWRPLAPYQELVTRYYSDVFLLCRKKGNERIERCVLRAEVIIAPEQRVEQ